MRIWHVLKSRLRSLVFRGRRESELSEELQLHLERDTERLQASGLPGEEARFQALRLFGGVEQVKEASRDARGTAAWDALVRDTRHGLRRLVRDWRFTTAAVLILGLAIGANTAIFSVVNAALFRDQGFADPGGLVDLYQNDPAGKPLIALPETPRGVAVGGPVPIPAGRPFNLGEPGSSRLTDVTASGRSLRTASRPVSADGSMRYDAQAGFISGRGLY